MGGKTPIDPDSMQPILEAFARIESRLDTLERATGTSRVGLVQQVQQAVANIGTAITAYLSAGFTTGSMTATGNVNVNGNEVVNGTITSPGVAGTNVTLLPGTRSALWVVDASGVIGQTTSSIRYKTDLAPVEYTAAQFLAVMPLMFRYIGQLDIRNNPENANFDPEYVVPMEVGMIAEHLLDAGLDLYVLFEVDGVTPTNIDYPTFGAHAALVIGRDHEDRISRLEGSVATVLLP